jgi:hypothetical protein
MQWLEASAAAEKSFIADSRDFEGGRHNSARISALDQHGGILLFLEPSMLLVVVTLAAFAVISTADVTYGPTVCLGAFAMATWDFNVVHVFALSSTTEGRAIIQTEALVLLCENSLFLIDM